MIGRVTQTGDRIPRPATRRDGARLALVTAAVGLALTGCSSSDGATGSASTSTAPPTPTVTATPQPSITASPVSFRQQATYADGVQVAIVGVQHSKSTGSGPGEIPGRPVTTFSVRFANGSNAALDLTRVVVEVSYGTPKQQAQPVYDAGVSDFATTVPTGKTAVAKYAFSIPAANLDDAELTVRFDTAHQQAMFTGRVSALKTP